VDISSPKPKAKRIPKARNLIGVLKFMLFMLLLPKARP
jgi:hypothetical protein